MTAYRDFTTTKITRKAYIESMPVSNNQFNCFSFYAQIIGSNSSLQIFALQFEKDSQKNFIQNLRTVNNLTQKWTKFNIKIDSNLWFNNKEISFRIKGSLSESNSFIALDDISLTSNSECYDSPQELFDCFDGTQIESTRVCNFVKDCSQGEDEKDCGTCDFEMGTISVSLNLTLNSNGRFKFLSHLT